MSVDVSYATNYVQSSRFEMTRPIPTGVKDNNLASLMFVANTGTGAPVVVFLTQKDSMSVTNIVSVSIAKKLHSIKDKLGLNLSQLSKILNVSRPQLYKWLEGDVIPQRDEFNHKISDIYSFLDVIPNHHGRYFGKLANRYISDEHTVLDVLIDSGLTKNKLLTAYNSIKGDIESIDIRKAKKRAKHSSSNALEVILPPR